ncbi:MAG: FAD-dependent oxidoreductase [Aeromicrobium sp.]
MRIAGWGRFPAVDAEVSHPSSMNDVAALVAAGPLIARGLGRSYGDSSLGERMIDLTRLDALLGFDDATGLLTCEAGVSLSTIISVLLPRGWFLPVSPGTRFVTVGGAIASDVHGKNHHVAGSFADHVESLTMMLADGSVLRASRGENADLFHATCGGMGLTGIILSASIRMLAVQSARIDEHLIKTPDLAATLEVFEGFRDTTYSVAWIDLLASCAALGRSLVMLGEHAVDGDVTGGPTERLTPFPVDLPSGLLNRHTVRAFNTAYYQRVRGNEVRHQVSLDAFFYPLDKVGEWNRAYGSRGFLQHQFVIPFDGGRELLHEIVDVIARSGLASPLAVLKTMGDANDSMLGFPSPGFTLALDLKVSDAAFDLCNELDRLVIDAGGRIYLTKDSRMSPKTFRAGYRRLDEFEAVRKTYGAAGVFVSAQSQRLGLA